jgi:lysozyme
MSGVLTFGIDVSHHQGKIDWDKVKAGPTNFVFMKATEGTSFVSPTFRSNWDAAAGLNRGAYHFFRPSVSGAEQAAHFLATYRPRKGDLRPALDIEDFDGSSKAGFQREVDAWLDAVGTAISDKRPFIYTSASFWQKIGNPSKYSDCPIWVAHYTRAAGPNLPKGWSDYTIWQYSQSGTVDGVRGDCDVNLFNGDPDALTQLLV